MKKVFLKLACTIGALIAFASCQNALEQREFLMIETKNIQYAALTVSNDCGTSRSLDVSEIKFASIIVSGHDIEEADEPKLEYIPVTDGKNNGSITLERIPVGVDRIVTVKAFDKDKNELPNFQIRAVTDIKSGNENTVIVNKSTTAFGDVLYGIKSIYNFEELEKDGRMDTVRAVIDTEIHPSLYNSSKLIGELQGFSFPYSASKEDYVLSPGSITFNYLLAQNFNVSINDPISEALTNQSAGNGIKIDNIVPGNWILTISDSEGNILDKNEIQIESGNTTKLEHLEHNGIAILMQQGKKSGGKEYNHIHFWDLVYDENIPESQKLEKTSWPGIAITTKITAENFTPENYYLYDFANVKSVKLLITNGNGKNSVKYCNDDMLASQKGVYCVHSTGLVPLTKISEPDTPIDNLKITGEHLKKCFIDDPENKRFVVLFDENLYGAKPQSVKAEFNKGINDHNGEYKGSHYSMTQHSKGFWYCSVPYEDVQATNQCGQPSYNFKVDGNIINPPSYVPDGYIYQKFNASNAGKAFLCLIYNSQDENEICSRLFQAKKCKKLKDFDLSTEEGQQQISNFRLVPGTTTLFRSFHPYNDDDKKSISDTSKKRMEYVIKLSEKAGIKADINLSDTSQKNATYGMPEYYQKIIDNNAVLYMTDCSYGQCYETPDSEQFGKGIAKIVRFINKTEGPYQIHCAIGTDRTGVVCAVLAGLCGADINQITEDYCKSIEMGIYEYRGPGAVRYSLQKILGVQFLEDIPDLKQGLTDYFVKNKYLSKSEIEKMQEKLQQK